MLLVQKLAASTCDSFGSPCRASCASFVSPCSDETSSRSEEGEEEDEEEEVDILPLLLQDHLFCIMATDMIF